MKHRQLNKSFSGFNSSIEYNLVKSFLMHISVPRTTPCGLVFEVLACEYPIIQIPTQFHQTLAQDSHQSRLFICGVKRMLTVFGSYKQ